MAYTTTQLITNAFYGSGVVSREFETVSGPQISDGLNWLNDIISEKNIDHKMVPYETTYDFTAVPGQEAYVIAGLLKVDTLVFFLDQVRYAMMWTPRNEYFGSSRVDNINTLPFEWYFERGLNGGTVYIYFKPDKAYPIQIHGVFQIPNVALGQDLTLVFEEFFRTYLRYALMDRICAEYSYSTPANVAKQLAKYESFIAKKSRVLDLRMTKVSTLNRIGSFNYGFVNLGKGWVRPG